MHCILLHMLKQEAPKYHSRLPFLCVMRVCLRYNTALNFQINKSTSFCLLNPLFETNSTNKSNKKVVTLLLLSNDPNSTNVKHPTYIMLPKVL